MSIREKLMMFVLIGTVLPLMLVFTVSYTLQSKGVRKSVETSLTAEATQNINALHQRVLHARHNLNNFRRLPISDADATQKKLNYFSGNNPVFSNITVLNSQGDVIASTDELLKDANLSDLTEFKKAINGKLHFAAPTYSDDLSDFISVQAIPIQDVDDKVSGVVLGTLNWGQINSELANTKILGETQSKNRIITLTSLKNDTVIYQTTDANLTKDARATRSYGATIEVENSGREFVSITTTAKSEDPFKDSTLLLNLLIDKNTAYAEVRRLCLIYLWIGLGVFLLVGAMWWMLSQSLSKRIDNLAEGARELAKGNFKFELDEQAKQDDIGQLAQSFSFMRRTIEQNENSLIEKTEAAEQAAKLKGEFLANMSHEVRTPINGVLGMAELMLQTNLDINQKRYASTILRSGQSLLSVVNDILDFSKIEAGKLDITNAPFDLRETVEDVCEMLAESAHRKGLELNIELSPDMHVAFNGDAGRLRQILINLISNAIKFTSNGEVKVCVHTLPSKNDSHSTIKFEIIDSGIGISTEQQSRIFREFEQADGSTTREFGGSGLGLAISKKLTEMMGGGIGVSSSKGEGSTFWFTTRVERLPQSIQQRWSSAESLKERRFLIVDDNQTNRDILREQLAHWGAETLVANNADHALQLVKDSIKQNHIIDVAIVDHQMPGMSGIDFIKTVQQSWPDNHINYVVLSSVNENRDSEATKLLAEYSHITKPARQKDLYNCLAAALGDENAINASIDSKKLELTNFNGRVLLVEDNPVNQDMMLEMLRLMGVKVDLAENGQEAVDLTTETQYDLVFMDCQMPVMDGFKATAKIRELESSKIDGHKHSIVALTANALEGDRERCIDAGMNDYLCKPINTAELRLSLQKWLPENADTNYGHTNEVTAIPEAMPKSAPESTDENETTTLPTINQNVYQQVLDMCEQASDGFYDRLMDKYVQSSDEDLDSIQAAIAASDAEKIRNSAHRLKSSSGNWGGARVADLCQKLELAGQDKDIESANTLFKALTVEVKVLIGELHDQQNAA